MAFARDDERVEDSGALAGIGMADEEPVFLADARRTNRVFTEIVVQAALPMVQMRDQRPPLTQEIIARVAERRLRPHALSHPPSQAAQAVHRAGELLRFRAFLGALPRLELLLVPFSLAAIHPRNQSQRRLGDARMTTTTAAASAGFPGRRLEFKYDHLGRRVQKRVIDTGQTLEISSRRLFTTAGT